MGRHGPQGNLGWMEGSLARVRGSVIRPKRAQKRAREAVETSPRMPPNAIDTGIPTRQVKHLNFRPAQGTWTVAKPELGTKRLCANCGAKFYDLSKDPIVCPKCHTVLEVAAVSPRSRPDAAAAARARSEAR